MWEEARFGCPHECQRLAKSKDETISQAEANFIIGQIEEMADEYAVGEVLKQQDYEIWKWELFTYCVKLERDFQRNIWVKIGSVADTFLRQK